MNYNYIKRAIDITGSVAGLIATMPVAAAVTAALLIQNKDSVFYKQKRIGKDGKEFEIYKFNTMTEKKGEDDLSSEAERITPVGTFLRKYSLNELPQLLNVFKGDMSLIGPRPWTYECYEYQQITVNYPHLSGYLDARHTVKPGLVCLHGANLCSRNKVRANGTEKKPRSIDKHDWIRQLATDNFYVRHHNTFMDICIFKNALVKSFTGRTDEITGNNDIYSPKSITTAAVPSSHANLELEKSYNL